MVAGPLCEGRLTTWHLRAVRRRRSPAVRLFQLARRRVVARALAPEEPFESPRSLELALRVPVLRGLPARLSAFGTWSVRVGKAARGTEKGW